MIDLTEVKTIIREMRASPFGASLFALRNWAVRLEAVLAKAVEQELVVRNEDLRIGNTQIQDFLEGRAVVVSAADFAMMRSVKRIADTGTAENFLKLSDTDKRRWFAMALEESSRRKAAEQKVEDLSLDANRYRKLRKCVWNQSPLAVVRDPKRAVRLGYDCPSHDRLDEVVDQLPNLGEAE